jgi:hypothetical protein
MDDLGIGLKKDGLRLCQPILPSARGVPLRAVNQLIWGAGHLDPSVHSVTSLAAPQRLSEAS